MQLEQLFETMLEIELSVIKMRSRYICLWYIGYHMYQKLLIFFDILKGEMKPQLTWNFFFRIIKHFWLHKFRLVSQICLDLRLLLVYFRFTLDRGWGIFPTEYTHCNSLVHRNFVQGSNSSKILPLQPTIKLQFLSWIEFFKIPFNAVPLSHDFAHPEQTTPSLLH